MSACEKRSFGDELLALSVALEQASRSALLLKGLHQDEIHNAVSEVREKVQQLGCQLPAGCQLPVNQQSTAVSPQVFEVLETCEADRFFFEVNQTKRTSKRQESTHSKTEKYLPKAHTESLCVLPNANLSSTAFDANTASNPVVTPHSPENFSHAVVAYDTLEKSPARVLSNSSVSKKGSARSFGEVREIWQDAKEESVALLTSRHNLRVLHYDDASMRRPCDHHHDFMHIGSLQIPYANLLGQGLYDVAFGIMSPVGSIRFFWNVMCLFFIAYDLFMVPMQAFKIDNVQELQVLEWLLTSWWTLDVYMTFRTGFIVGTRVEMRAWQIAKRYACTWLWIDLMIVMVEWGNRFASAFASASIIRTKRVLRFFRFLKLFRVGKVSRFWRSLQDRLNSNVAIVCVAMIFMVFILLLALHIAACIWYALGESRNDGWTAIDEYQGEKNKLFWYIAAVRWVVAQFNGRTDTDERRNMAERFYTCAIGIALAVIARALFISLITKALFNLGEVVSEKTRRRQVVNEYLEANPLSPLLTSHVKRCLHDYQDIAKELQHEEQVLAILPKRLQTCLREEVRAPVLMQHPFFHALPFESPYVMRLICCSVVQPVSAAKDEKVFGKGDICERMLFTDKLTATYGIPVDSNISYTTSPMAKPSNKNIKAMTSRAQFALEPFELTPGRLPQKVHMGSWVSEAAVWVDWRNQGCMVSNGHGVLLAVCASNLAQALKRQHSDVFSLAYLHAMTVAAELSNQDASELSDILPFEVQLHSLMCVMVTVVSATGLRNADAFLAGKSDPYCVCKVVGMEHNRGETHFKTKTVDNDLNPVWNHSAEVLLTRHQLIEFSVWDYDFSSRDDALGVARLLPDQFAIHGFEGDLPLTNSGDQTCQASLKVKVKVISREPKAQGLLHLWQPARKIV